MKVFLSIAGVLAWLFGAMLLVAPAPFYAPTGIAFTPMLETLAQAHGATLFGTGTVLWLSRNATGRAAVPVLAGNLVVQLLSLAVVIRTMTLGAGAAVAPGIVIHVVLGSGFLWFLGKARAGAR